MRALRSPLHKIAWLGVTILTVWSWREAPVPRQPDWDALGVSLSPGWVYRTDGSRSLTLDICQPAQWSNRFGRGRLRPAIIAVHGGSWIGGSITNFRSNHGNAVIRLAQQGLVVFAVEYRLARPGSPSWPAVLDDLRAAVRWVRSHSNEFGIDPDRIAVLGQSAGGHLAALLGTLPDQIGEGGVSARVQAVVSFYGPCDLLDLMATRHLAHEPVRILVGNADSRAAERAALASPIKHVTNDDPPMLLVHGSDDAWVPVVQSVRMAAALAQAGVPHRLIVVEGARHGFETLIEYPAQRDLLPEILAFLETAWNSSVVAGRLAPSFDDRTIHIHALVRANGTCAD